MNKEMYVWKSKNLSKDMEIAVYGHFGFSILLFPTFTDKYLENENNGLINSIENFVKNGKCKVYSIGSVNSESWLNKEISNEEKSNRHFEYNNYIIDEVIPFIYDNNGGVVPIITCGASLGAFHAVNHYLRRPDLFLGVIGLSGIYDLKYYSKEFFDENCYFNSPIHYLPGLNDNYWLSFLTSKHHVYILSGSGYNEQPGFSTHLSEILMMKNISHFIDIWGSEWGHDVKTWVAMLNHIIGTKI